MKCSVINGSNFWRNTLSSPVWFNPEDVEHMLVHTASKTRRPYPEHTPP